MLKAKIIILFISSLCLIFSPRAFEDLANLSMTLHSLSNRAQGLGLFSRPTHTNPKFSDNLNQIIEAIETRNLISQGTSLNKITETVNSILRLISNKYKVKEDQISLNYEGFKLRTNLEQFSNELLLIANIADYISSKYSEDEVPEILSNMFTNPILYLLLDSILKEEKRKFNLTIIGGISNEMYNKFKKKGMKSKYYQNIKEFNQISEKIPMIDIMLLNYEVAADHSTENLFLCEKTIQNKLTKIRILPEKEQFNSKNFLINCFVAVDQDISSEDTEKILEQIIQKTKGNSQTLKSQRFEEFPCYLNKQTGSKIIADIVHTKAIPKTKLFLSAYNRIITLQFKNQDLSNIINLYGIITKTIVNLRDQSANINANLKNDMQFYKYDKLRKKFIKYKNINSFTATGINLSDKI